jgi:hypothetical protein
MHPFVIPGEDGAGQPVEEALLTALWSEVLGGAPVGLGESTWQDFSFLDALDRARQAGVPVTLQQATKTRTVAMLAGAMAAEALVPDRASGCPSEGPGELRPAMPQRRAPSLGDGGRPRLSVDDEMCERLADLGGGGPSSRLEALLAAAITLLSRFAGTEGVEAGIALDPRAAPFGQLFSAFVHDATLAIDLSEDPCLTEVVDQVHARAVDAFGSLYPALARLLDVPHPVPVALSLRLDTTGSVSLELVPDQHGVNVQLGRSNGVAPEALEALARHGSCRSGPHSTILALPSPSCRCCLRPSGKRSWSTGTTPPPISAPRPASTNW